MNLQITRGGDFSAAVDFQNADGSAINLTGFTVTGVIEWRGGSLPVTFSDVNRPLGQMAMSLTELQTPNIPRGAVSTMTITYTSAGGDTKKQSVPVEGL